MAEPITVESITSTVESPDQLTPEQKTFLETNAATLTDEVADKYGIEKAPVIPEPPAIPDPETPPAKKEDDVDLDDEKKIGAIVAKQMEGLTREQRETAVTVKVDSFLHQNTQVANPSVYREAMIKYAKHPHYQNLSAKELFNIVAGDELMRMGAKKEREAAAKAKSTQVNGSNGGRPAAGGPKKDWNTATAEELRAEQARVLGRQGV